VLPKLEAHLLDGETVCAVFVATVPAYHRRRRHHHLPDRVLTTEQAARRRTSRFQIMHVPPWIRRQGRYSSVRQSESDELDERYEDGHRLL
jgi:hypothetical protein